MQKEKQKVINRNHWMFRLYRYCWDSEFQYKGYCSLFWITWFNIFLLPLIWLGRIVVGVFGWLNDLIPEKYEKPKSVKKLKPYCPDDDMIVYLYNNQHEGWSHRSYRLQRWLDENPNWLTEVYPAVKKRLEQKEIVKQLNAKRKEKLDQKMEKLVGYLQYLVKPFLVLTAFLIAWSIYNLIGLIIKNITWENIKNLGIGMLIAGGAILFVWGFWRCILWLHVYDNLKSLKRESGYDSNKCEPNRFLAAIEEGFTFLKNTIQIVYYRKCPLIVLTDDETRPIEKIKSEK